MSWTIHDTRGFLVTDLTPDQWGLCEAVPNRTESGPDDLALTYEGFWGTAAGTSPALTSFMTGAVPPSYAGPGTWRIVSAVPRRMYGPFWSLDVRCKGQVEDKGPKIRWVTGSASFSAEDISVPGFGGLVPKVSSRNPEVGMELSYLSFAASPSTPAPGVAAVPPTPRPADPTNIWSAIPADKAVVHYPSGWVREAVDADRIVANLWWITERYNYIFPVTG